MVDKIIRPEGFEHEVRDCTVRAFALATNIDYIKVHDIFKEYGRKDKHSFRVKKVFNKICKALNVEARMVQRSGTVRKLIKKYPQGNFYCIKRDHAFAVIDGMPHDLESINSHIKAAYWVRPMESVK